MKGEEGEERQVQRFGFRKQGLENLCVSEAGG